MRRRGEGLAHQVVEVEGDQAGEGLAVPLQVQGAGAQAAFAAAAVVAVVALAADPVEQGLDPAHGLLLAAAPPAHGA